MVFNCTLLIHIASQTTKILRKSVPPSMKHVIFTVNIKSPYSKSILIKKRKNKGPHSIFCFAPMRWSICCHKIVLYSLGFLCLIVSGGAVEVMLQDWGLCYVKLSPFVSTSSFPFVHCYHEIWNSSSFSAAPYSKNRSLWNLKKVKAKKL